MPATFDIELSNGDTRQLVFPVNNLDTGNFASLSDVDSVEYILIDSFTTASSESIVTKTLSDSNVEITTAGDFDTVELDDISDTVDVISVLLTPTETAKLPTQNVKHELQIEDTSGNITTVMQGDVETTPTAIEPRQD